MSKKKRDSNQPVEEKYEEVRQLIALGKDRGYLAVEEITEMLPDDLTASPEEIEEVYEDEELEEDELVEGVGEEGYGIGTSEEVIAEEGYEGNLGPTATGASFHAVEDEHDMESEQSLEIDELDEEDVEEVLDLPEDVESDDVIEDSENEKDIEEVDEGEIEELEVSEDPEEEVDEDVEEARLRHGREEFGDLEAGDQPNQLRNILEEETSEADCEGDDETKR